MHCQKLFVGFYSSFIHYFSFFQLIDLIFRYKEDSQQPFPSSPDSDNSNRFVGSSSDSNDNEVYTLKAVLRQCYNIDGHSHPTRLSSKVSVGLIISICMQSMPLFRIQLHKCLISGALLVVLDSLLVALEDKLSQKDVASLVAVGIVFLVIIVTIVALQQQPSSAKRISFQVKDIINYNLI